MEGIECNGIEFPAYSGALRRREFDTSANLKRKIGLVCKCIICPLDLFTF